MKNPLVSVIIVTMRNKLWLDKCLQALQKQRYKEIEIIIIDNAAEKSLKDFLREKYSACIYLQSKTNVGYGTAANRGIRMAQGEYILIYNDDAICDKDFIKNLVHRIEQDETIGAIQGTILLADKKNIVESIGSFLTPTGILIKDSGFSFDKKELKEQEVFNANFPLIRKKVFDQIGYFDEDYFLYFEEADVCWRILLSGKRILYYPDAVLFHGAGVTTKRLPAKWVVASTFKNRMNSLLKNYQTKNLFLLFPLHLFICMGAIGVYLLRGKLNCAGAICTAMWWNIIHFSATLQKRKSIQQTRTVSDDDLFKKIMRPMSAHYFLRMSFDYLKQW